MTSGGRVAVVGLGAGLVVRPLVGDADVEVDPGVGRTVEVPAGVDGAGVVRPLVGLLPLVALPLVGVSVGDALGDMASSDDDGTGNPPGSVASALAQFAAISPAMIAATAMPERANIPPASCPTIGPPGRNLNDNKQSAPVMRGGAAGIEDGWTQ